MIAKKPDISVIMSVNKNINNFLKQSIESILNQSFSNFEFIIINDGKDTEVEKIILKYKKKDSRIIYKFTDGIGLTASLNYGISFSSAKLIARQDYDDISYFDRLEKQLNFFTQNKEYVLCASKYKKIDYNNKILSTTSIVFDFLLLNTKNYNKTLIYKNPFIHSSCMFLKAIYYEANKYNEHFKYSQDYEIWTKMIKLGKFKVINKNLVKLRIHKNSISNLKNKYQRFYSFMIGLKFLFPVLENDISYMNNDSFLSYLKNKYKDNKNIYNQIIARQYVYLYEEVKTYKILFFSYNIIINIIKIYLNRPSYILHRLMNSF